MTPTADIVLESKACRPFGEVKGTVRWQRRGRTEGLELRLFWTTRGRGTREAGVVDCQPLDGSAEHFRFNLPGEPYSCSGRLVSIVWAVELVDGDGESIALEEFVLTPDGRELEMNAIRQPRSESRRRFGFRPRR